MHVQISMVIKWGGEKINCKIIESAIMQKKNLLVYKHNPEMPEIRIDNIYWESPLLNPKLKTLVNQLKLI